MRWMIRKCLRNEMPQSHGASGHYSKGKGWKYLLIPHDAMADNTTLARLEQDVSIGDL